METQHDRENAVLQHFCGHVVVACAMPQRAECSRGMTFVQSIGLLFSTSRISRIGSKPMTILGSKNSQINEIFGLLHFMSWT